MPKIQSCHPLKSVTLKVDKDASINYEKDAKTVCEILYLHIPSGTYKIVEEFVLYARKHPNDVYSLEKFFNKFYPNIEE